MGGTKSPRGEGSGSGSRGGDLFHWRLRGDKGQRGRQISAKVKMGTVYRLQEVGFTFSVGQEVKTLGRWWVGLEGRLGGRLEEALWALGDRVVGLALWETCIAGARFGAGGGPGTLAPGAGRTRIRRHYSEGDGYEDGRQGRIRTPWPAELALQLPLGLHSIAPSSGVASLALSSQL